MNVRNEIKAQIVRAGFTMQEVVDLLHDEYGWSDSVSNLSAKLQRESIRYKEVVELADYNTGFMELKQGSVDAIAADLGVAKFQIASGGEFANDRMILS